MSPSFSGKVMTVLLLVMILLPLPITASRFVNVAHGLDVATVALTEWAIPTPGSLPGGLVLDPSGNGCWFVESSGNKLVHFDPLTNTFLEWAIPTSSSNPTSIALTTISGSLVVVGTEFAKNRVFLFFPSTSVFKEYELPVRDSGPQYVSIEPGATEIKAWFTELGGPINEYERNSIGEIIYDPVSGTARLYELSLPDAAGGRANGIHAASGSIWVAGKSAIVKWDGTTSRFTTWTIPSHASNQAMFVNVDSSGQVWYTSRNPGASSTNYVGVLRGDNTFTEWEVPTLGADAGVISIDPVTGHPWVAEKGEDRVAKVDPSSGGIVRSSQPSTLRVDPARGFLFTTVSSPVLPSTVTVAPTSSTSTSSATDQFTEWVLAPGSGPQDVAVDSSGNVWILESSGNKIARLSLKADFALDCAPSSLNLVQDASGLSTCTVTSTYGFSSTVDLVGSWVGTAPTGVVFTLPTPITPSADGVASSTLTVVVGPTASTGTFTLQVRGTSGSLTHSMDVTVSIAAGVSDFAITASPSSVSIAPGGSAATTITVQSVGVFSSSVGLTSSGVPNGMTLAFGTNPVTPPIRQTVSSLLTVSVSGAPAGTHSITITGTSGPLTRSTTLTVQVTGGVCLIATATYGSELADEVQFLRGFRDRSILKTNAGSNFMVAFNGWYYSFSPGVAEFVREHPSLRTALKFTLYPLIGILRISAAVFDLFPTNLEAGAVASGLVATSLIGTAYFATPLTALFAHSSKARRIAKRLRLPALVVLLGATAFVALITPIAAPAIVMMVATSTIVVATLILSALFASLAILRLAKPIRACERVGTDNQQ